MHIQYGVPESINRYLLQDMPRYNLTTLRLYTGTRLLSSLAGAVLASSHLFTIITMIQMKKDIENTSNSSKETRNVFIGAKVTPTQKEYIKSMATQCGMTVSDYILSRAYNFKPKARLTKEEAVLLQNLDDCRSDLIKYTSALHGMSTKQRMAMFNQIPFMVNWLKELGNVAESVCQFLNAVKEKNKIPSNLKSEEE